MSRPTAIGLNQTTAPAAEPVKVSELKTWLGYGASDQDTQLTNLLEAARQWVEEYLRRQLITATWTLKLDHFPANEMDLPYPPLQSVTSITYTAVGGESTVLSASLYDVSTASARIAPAYNQSWPSVQLDLEPLSIVYVAGYGDSSSDVPETIRQAILMIAGGWWQQMQCGEGQSIPMAAKAMLSPYRVILL